MEAKQKVPPFLLELDSLSSDLLELGGKLHCLSVVVPTLVFNWKEIKITTYTFNYLYMQYCALRYSPPVLTVVNLRYMYDLFCLCTDDKGCAYCSGLGHRITECPKLEAIQQQTASSIGRKDYLSNSAADW